MYVIDSYNKEKELIETYIYISSLEYKKDLKIIECKNEK